jgi:hypothetical protein
MNIPSLKPAGGSLRQRREALGLAPGDTDPFFDGRADEQAENQPVRRCARRAAWLHRASLRAPWSVVAVLCAGACAVPDRSRQKPA